MIMTCIIRKVALPLYGLPEKAMQLLLSCYLTEELELRLLMNLVHLLCCICASSTDNYTVPLSLL